VGRPPGLEIDVAVEVIGEETDAGLQGDEFSRERQVLPLRSGEEVAGARQKPGEQCFEHFEPHGNFGEVDLVFLRRAGSAAHHVAEIVERESGHDGVEVKHADPFAGQVVDQQVVGLGVVVGDAFRDRAFGVEPQQPFRLFPALHDEVDFAADAGGAPRPVFADGVEQRRHPLRRVVKIRNRLMQPLPRKIDKIALELPERLRRAISLFRSFEHFVGAGVFDEYIGSPVVAAVVLNEGMVRKGAQQPDGPFAGLLPAAADFFEQVIGHPVDILHHLRRFAEHLVVDPL